MGIVILLFYDIGIGVWEEWWEFNYVGFYLFLIFKFLIIENNNEVVNLFFGDSYLVNWFYSCI